MAKKKLQIGHDFDFFLFGISCPERPYRVCWALNQQLKTDLSKDKDVELMEKGSRVPTIFSVFTFRDEEMFTDYRVILNKAGSKLLVGEYRQADYLLMVQGGIPSSEKSNILRKVKEVPFIQTAFEIDPQKIKSKEHFIF